MCGQIHPALGMSGGRAGIAAPKPNLCEQLPQPSPYMQTQALLQYATRAPALDLEAGQTNKQTQYLQCVDWSPDDQHKPVLLVAARARTHLHAARCCCNHHCDRAQQHYSQALHQGVGHAMRLDEPFPSPQLLLHALTPQQGMAAIIDPAGRHGWLPCGALPLTNPGPPQPHVTTGDDAVATTVKL